MPHSSSLPTPDRLTAALRSRLPGWGSVQWCAETGSTNVDLIQGLRQGIDPPCLLGTHQQHQGRGRAGRIFVTAPGAALMFSCGFAVSLPANALPMLTLWLGVATCHALAPLLPAHERLRLKWPNDLECRGHKLAGMLLESIHHPTRGNLVVAGLGLNLMGGEQLRQHWQRPIGDWQEFGGAADAATLVTTIAQHWQAAISIAERRWEPGVGLAALPSQFAEYDSLLGQEVVLIDHGQQIATGIADGVMADGRLRLQHPDRRLTLVSVGDISVRPGGKQS